jgi:hypothetical protein
MSVRFAALLALAVLPAGAGAQTLRVSGTVVDERQTPIQGAVVRITGSDTAMTTGPSGTFTFGSIVAGRLILTVAAPTYELRSIALELTRDTIITVAMRTRVTMLDPMVVRPRQVRIRGTVVDSATREPILFALVSLYPGGRTTDASNIGKFTFDTVSTGPVTIVAEAMEHLPIQVPFDARRDTTLTIKLAIDSVAVRMMARQVTRLEKRSQSEPYTVRSFNRDEIARENRSTVGELVDRLMLVPNDPRRRAGRSADEACVFYDDRKIAPGMLDGMYPELVERVEIYRRGAMIRVYSKRYVMSLSGQEMLRKVVYIPVVTMTVCE